MTHKKKLNQEELRHIHNLESLIELNLFYARGSTDSNRESYERHLREYSFEYRKITGKPYRVQKMIGGEW